MQRALTLCLCLLAVGASVSPWLHAAPQNSVQDEDQYFAGMVVETNPDQVTVSRVVQGKNESRVFRITSETKVEGRLAANVRVTVGFVTTDDGDRATLIIVRMVIPGKNKK